MSTFADLTIFGYHYDAPRKVADSPLRLPRALGTRIIRHRIAARRTGALLLKSWTTLKVSTWAIVPVLEHQMGAF